MTSTIVEQKVISADGTAVAYWRSGRGRPLVLVHGTTADHARWQPVLGRLEGAATVCALDRRGRGGSGDAAGYSVEREFEDVAAVVDAVAADAGEAVDLVGHSYGALCALEAARLTPNLRRVVLYEPVVGNVEGLYDHELVARMEAHLAAGERETALELFFREIVGMPEEAFRRFRTLPAWPARVAAAPTLVRELRAEEGYRFEPERFRAVTVPVLLLVGGQSPAFLREGSEAVAAALPDARIAVLEGQQHVAMDTAPDLFVDTLTAFLAG